VRIRYVERSIMSQPLRKYAVGDFKPRNGKTVSRAKKPPQKGHTVRLSAIKWNA